MQWGYLPGTPYLFWWYLGTLSLKGASTHLAKQWRTANRQRFPKWPPWDYWDFRFRSVSSLWCVFWGFLGVLKITHNQTINHISSACKTLSAIANCRERGQGHHENAKARKTKDEKAVQDMNSLSSKSAFPIKHFTSWSQSYSCFIPLLTKSL